MSHILTLKNPFLKTTFRRKIPSAQTFTLYLCGPTVYGPLHLGNFRNVFLFDVLYRFLQRNQQKTKYWQNITDIDDKIIHAAKQAKTTELLLTTKYFEEYQTLLQACNILKPTHLFVSQNIPAIIDFIHSLEKRGFTYRNRSGIYFEVSKLSQYALFQSTTSPLMQRNQFVIDKKNMRDFVLWKFTDRGQNWPSPWKNGRPGWHTECVALISKHNNQNPLTIHGGGRDLLFPHHENEAVQFETLYQQALTAFWLHNGLIVSSSGKISRSKNPTQSLNMKKLLTKYDHNTFRLFFFSQPYSKDITFSFSKMLAFQKIYQRWKKLFVQVHRLAHCHKHEHWREIIIPKTIKTTFEKHLANNLGIDKLFPLFFAWEKKIHIYFQRLHVLKGLKYAAYLRFALLGLGFDVPLPHWTIKAKKLLFNWAKAVQKQDYSSADHYRKQLQEANLWD